MVQNENIYIINFCIQCKVINVIVLSFRKTREQHLNRRKNIIIILLNI